MASLKSEWVIHQVIPFSGIISVFNQSAYGFVAWTAIATGLKSTDASHSKSRVGPFFWLSIVTSKSFKPSVQTAGSPWISEAWALQSAPLKDRRQLESPNNLQYCPCLQIQRRRLMLATVLSRKIARWTHVSRKRLVRRLKRRFLTNALSLNEFKAAFPAIFGVGEAFVTTFFWFADAAFVPLNGV